MANARNVKILVKGRYYITSMGNIAETLTRQGWQIVSVDYSSGVLYPDIIVTATVLNNYSDQDILNNIRLHLSGLMDISSASIISDAQAAKIPQNNSTSSALNNALGGLAPTIGGMSIGAVIGLAVVAVLVLPKLLDRR